MIPEVRRLPIRYGLGDDATDAATAAAQHQLALTAHNAKLAGDWDTYTRAIEGLFMLGARNVSEASLNAMLDISKDQSIGNFFGGLSQVAWAGVFIVGGVLLWQSGLLKRKREAA